MKKGILLLEYKLELRESNHGCEEKTELTVSW